MSTAKWLTTFLCSRFTVWCYIKTSIANDNYHLKDIITRPDSKFRSKAKIHMSNLIEKFVAQGYRIGIDFEGVLYKTGKSLDTLAKQFGGAF